MEKPLGLLPQVQPPTAHRRPRDQAEELPAPRPSDGEEVLVKLFTCTDHDGHWPVGVASIVLADNEMQAGMMLAHELLKKGLDPVKPAFTLTEVDMSQPCAIILNDGDY